MVVTDGSGKLFCFSSVIVVSGFARVVAEEVESPIIIIVSEEAMVAVEVVVVGGAILEAELAVSCPTKSTVDWNGVAIPDLYACISAAVDSGRFVLYSSNFFTLVLARTKIDFNFSYCM